MTHLMNLVFSLLFGTLTGLGIGGGSLLLLYLTLYLHMDPLAARSISLLFFFPSALTSLFLHRKEIPFKSLLPSILLGLLSAFLFSLLSAYLPLSLLRKAYALLLILISLKELRHPQ